LGPAAKRTPRILKSRRTSPRTAPPNKKKKKKKKKPYTNAAMKMASIKPTVP